MRRGQNSSSHIDPELGYTKKELLETSGLSPKTFDLIRKAARVSGPTHGGNLWVFSVEDLITLVQRAESGRFSERGEPAGKAWRILLEERGVRLEPSTLRRGPERK
ncbi:MAG: hypothetical protein H7210_02235 [Pyrinomonadaceae bacterium]|nr:hypothetical protein [Phycisphaerales bacterium]